MGSVQEPDELLLRLERDSVDSRISIAAGTEEWQQPIEELT